MAKQSGNEDFTMEAAADLSTKQFYAVYVDSAGKAALVAAAGVVAIGVLQNKPAAAGREATIRTGGMTKMIAAGTIAPGALVSIDANGKATTATKGKTDTSNTGAAADALVGSNVFGVAMNTANTAAGDVFPVRIMHLGAVPTTAA